ncbi:hypothetical protein [Natrinema halophilum]|uniref:Uncharacterized protein n=1 Tax=Natrinema halophilum TaxID=1699371 RepID=A0A7D5KQ02_9EURY|nr:hypothetical protein [Natrinema halophilum]QLG47837.1 hypothetical protein HYG82_02755 [Natrinema halophilum]
MTNGPEHPVRVRLEEVLADVWILDGEIIEPLSLEPAIRNIEETIEVYKRIEADDSYSTEDDR